VAEAHVCQFSLEAVNLDCVCAFEAEVLALRIKAIGSDICQA
jgi:hypothetical protein